MSVYVLVISLALGGQLADDDRYGAPRCVPAASQPASPSQSLPLGSPRTNRRPARLRSRAPVSYSSSHDDADNGYGSDSPVEPPAARNQRSAPETTRRFSWPQALGR